MENTYEPLFSRDGKQKVLRWDIAVINNGVQVDIRKSYGEYGGAQVLRWERNIKGKNIGKANETTPFEQACLQAESAIRRKMDKGYKRATDLGINSNDPNLFSRLLSELPLNRTDASGNIKPMKAQQYYRSKKNWTAPDGTVWDDRKYYYMKNPHVEKEKGSIITKFPCIAQPKINGVRATLSIHNGQPKLLSKEGKEYNIPHILDWCKLNLTFFNYQGVSLVFDGELYIHGESLQEISSAVKKVSLITQRVRFYLFDVAIDEVDQMKRVKIIRLISEAHPDLAINGSIKFITNHKAYNDDDAQALCDTFINQGYEGAIFRSPSANYKFGGRPMTMTKLKRTISEEFKIVDVLPQKKDPLKGNFVCITKDGKRFQVNPKATEEYKTKLLAHKNLVIGKNLTLDFYEWTVDLKPFHIIDMSIRDYE